MIICPACGKEIEVLSLKNSFKLTLGNMKKGKFYEEKELFYHKNCLLACDILK